MKLIDLFEVQKSTFSDEEVTKAFASAKAGAEYKRIVIDMGVEDTTSKVQANRGTFRFKLETSPHPLYKGITYTNDRFYKIYAHGMIRIGDEKHHGPLKVPELTSDNMLENYKRMLGRVGDLIANAKGIAKLPELPKRQKQVANTLDINSFVTNGAVEIVNKDIKTLKGLPKKVKSLTITSNSYLDDLSNGPEEVIGAVTLNKVWIKSLKGCPKARELNIWNLHELTSLEGIPDGIETLTIRDCPKLVSLKHLPKTISKLSITYCPIWSLEDLPLSLLSLSLHGVDLGSLAGLGTKYLKRCNKLSIYEFTVKSHALALLLISNKDTQFHWVRASTNLVADIISKHIRKGKDGLIECQHELIDEGFNEQAKI